MAGFIRFVRRVSIVTFLAAISSVAGAWTHAASPFYGWTCRSVDEPHLVYVGIQQSSRNGDYSMRVMRETGEEDRGPTVIATFDHVGLVMDADSIRFAGQERQVSAELAIDQSEGRLNRLESVLRMDGEALSDTQTPGGHTIRLICDRTR